jgi:hypothetical protein
MADRIIHMFGFEEQWDRAEWTVNGIYSSNSNNDPNFSPWANTSPTAGFITGSRSYKVYDSANFATTGHYDTAIWTEDNSGTGACVSGRAAVTVMVDNIGGSGRNNYPLLLKPKGVSIGTASGVYTHWYIAGIHCVASGATWIATLYIRNTAMAVLPITMSREVPMRFGIEWFWEDNRYAARALFNGVAVSDWHESNDNGISPPSQSICIQCGGLNYTNSSGGITGTKYATCFDDLVHISDTITDIDTTTQVVTRDEVEPPNVCEDIYVRALDVASISANAGTWTGSAADIDIASSADTATKVETTDTVTAKPLRMDVAFDALSGTAPAAVLGMTVRCNASKDTFVTDLQMSEDNFVSTITDATTTLGAGATPTEISTTVKAAGGALDVTAIDAMELGFRVTA